MQKIVVNCETGEQECVEMTAAEVAELEAERAESTAETTTPSVAERLAAVEAALALRTS